LKRLRIIRKKIKRYKEQDSAKVAAYHNVIKDINPKSIAYIDEMGMDTFIYREKGCKGHRVRAKQEV